ncbi:hypothetical protein QN416_25645, partial [Glaciimonas sp. Cout2]|nr:hypothetical protein [Glaciimonas sp. Cout2]
PPPPPPPPPPPFFLHPDHGIPDVYKRQVLGALGMMLAVELFNRKSIYGKAVVATANDRDAEGLMGCLLYTS